STVTVTDGPSGTSASVVGGSAGGGWSCARAVAATASMAVPLISARRPTVLGDGFGMGDLNPRCYPLARSNMSHAAGSWRIHGLLLLAFIVSLCLLKAPISEPTWMNRAREYHFRTVTINEFRP